VDCGDFNSLVNGRVSVINTTYQSRVNFTCQDGYNLIGSSSAVCLVNGSWSNPTPVCSLVNGRVSVINTTYQSRVNFTCQDGYNLIGSSSAVCLVNGSWSNPTPVCSIVDCGDPSLMNGKVHVINTNYQSRANFTCQDGYNLIGSSSAVCLVNGSWSNPTPVCSIVDCGDPSLMNGKVHVINTNYQSRANFTCQDGYNLIGSSSSVCSANGQWSNQLPLCTSKRFLWVNLYS
jgi:CUB/sushi domain-containing protein